MENDDEEDHADFDGEEDGEIEFKPLHEDSIVLANIVKLTAEELERFPRLKVLLKGYVRCSKNVDEIWCYRLM